MKPETEKTLLHCLFITLAVLIPYQQVANHRFVEFDDGIYTYLNSYIIKGLTWDSLVWAFTNTETANWHPLTWITHLVDRELFGPHSGGYFLMNLTWHTLAACLCYIAFFKVTKRRFFALSVAIIFALHPANVENAAWNSERKSLVDAFFWFLGIIAYIDFLETRKLKFYGMVFITHLLGLMGKPMHVTFPCTLVLIHLLHLLSTRNGQACSRHDYRLAVIGSIKLVWPLLVISAYFCAVTASAQTMSMSNLDMLPITGRVINVLLSYQRYVLMFFSPGDLAPFYPLFHSELQLAKVVFPILFLGCITAFMLIIASKHPIPLLGWFWFLGTMVPVVGIVQVGYQSHADRYLYIPMIGLAFIFPELFERLCSWKKSGLALAQTGWLVLISLSLGFATYVQVGYWKDGVSLFQHSLSVTGDCVTTVNCLGSAYLRNERYAEAILFLEQKILVAKNPYNQAKLYSTKSQAHLALHQYEAAIDSANQSIAKGKNESVNYVLLADAYFHLDRKDLAEKAIISAKQNLGQANQAMFVDLQIRNAIMYFEQKLQDDSKTSPKKKESRIENDAARNPRI